MKRLLISMGTLLLTFLCKENFAQEKISYPYKATYSSDFKMGKAAQAKMILELWKDFDDNAFDRHNYMADTVTMQFSDGSMARGKDSVLAGAKKYRGAMSTCTSLVDAWVPLKIVDRNEDWVAVWGSEIDTYPDGKTGKRDLHEIWKFNKDGKVDFMKQFASVPAAR